EEESQGLPLRVPHLSRRQRRATRLVGLVPGGDAEAAQRSQCTVLVRSELTPEGFRDCLVSVAAGASAPAGSARRPGTDGGWGVSPRQVRREPQRSADSPVGSLRAALAEAGDRLRRVGKRKGTLLVVVVALAAGAFGPSSRAEGLTGATMTATPVTETVPVESDGDAAADVAVWVNPADRAASLVIGTDKRGAIELYDLRGKRVQRIARPAGTTASVDLRSGFALAGRTVTLVATGGRALSFFGLDPAGRQLHEVGADDFPTSGPAAGICLYRSGVTGRFYAFLTEDDGDVTQYELFDQGGFVDARRVRSWPLGAAASYCVADDETGRLFVSEESGVWRYDAEPDASPLARKQVDRAGGDHLTREVGGVALVIQPGRQGFLLASSEGDSTFAVYRRGQDYGWLGQRQVVDGAAADGCSSTTGIEAVAADLGPQFPAGIFICQDGRNTAPGSAGRQNFKFVRLDRLIDTASLPA
ncbi:MAG: phytase, partial [Actinobacteria bacterium]|nr:phytase [Actinomycetota bacterium]